MQHGKIILLSLLCVLLACSGERTEGEQPTSAPTERIQFVFDSNSFTASKIKAYTAPGEEENTTQLVVVGESEDGQLAEFHLKNISRESSSLSVEKGAEASFTYRHNDDLCTTALTMDNDSSINIDQHDPVTNLISGSFSGFDCGGSIENTVGAGSFAVTYEEVTLENSLLLDLNATPLVPAMVFVSATPEPINTIQITGFNGGTESYTLILKNDLPAGTYAMNEFDFAPYFFYSDADLNQYETVSGQVTLEAFDEFDRVLRGNFVAELVSVTDAAEVHCEGQFEIFVF